MSGEARPLVFLGTPSAAAVVLERLIAEGFDVRHVVTRPDAKRGRGSRMSASPVKEVALQHNISVSHDLKWIEENSIPTMLGIVVAYGRIIPVDILQRVPMINIHFSLLPRWRGAAPVERAILAGDLVTGVCIMDIEESLDTGAVYARREVKISDSVTAAELTATLAQCGADLLVETLRLGLPDPVPQQGEPTYAAKIVRDENKINWADSAVSIGRKIRALRAYAAIGESRVRIIEASISDEVHPVGAVSANAVVGTGSGSIQLIRVQPEGKQAMDAASWIRGRPHGESVVFD